MAVVVYPVFTHPLGHYPGRDMQRVVQRAFNPPPGDAHIRKSVWSALNDVAFGDSRWQAATLLLEALEIEVRAWHERVQIAGVILTSA